MNQQTQHQAEVLEHEADKQIDKTFGAAHRNNGYIQPLHHHSYAAAHRSHQRNKLRELK